MDGVGDAGAVGVVPQLHVPPLSSQVHELPPLPPQVQELLFPPQEQPPPSSHELHIQLPGSHEQLPSVPQPQSPEPPGHEHVPPFLHPQVSPQLQVSPQEHGVVCPVQVQVPPFAHPHVPPQLQVTPQVQPPFVPTSITIGLLFSLPFPASTEAMFRIVATPPITLTVSVNVTDLPAAIEAIVHCTVPLIFCPPADALTN